MENILFYVIAFTVPTIITGVIAYYFFNLHTKNEEGRRRFLIQKDAQKNAMPIRLQAYERMALFLERISPAKLLTRTVPESADKNDYERLLIRSIESEFDHNIAQQIYMSDECWNIVKTAKNATIQLIRKAGMQAETANKLRETVLNELLEKQPPSSAALAFIKKEVDSMW
ncbi:hypothetical protein SAMN04487906_1009 [Zhouia amylolytica]|uniref:Uncharacterized protein n=2 Tax=Zhouia amylolytica TaxID=376730 RepID=W2UNL3_9FLAO|nr:hypothetical protein [Zhouia amylolytica]ETN95593.1 hypothetical protein P278_13150 [Zhouia amylolytica AD3]MCQ0110786.1 hypothetical protein [Zhouia amylolytica]SFS57557.1 hypothetical protein SAMN04487906_1009 [Zhouia amylolytica]